MPPPSPNPVSLFRWEESSALEHSCWACPTKSNSPKAIHSCYGIHSMPCIAYHSTMHAVGTSHRCSACMTSHQMHEARHREIAEMIAEYHAHDLALSPAPRRGRHILIERSNNVRLRDLIEAEGRDEEAGERSDGDGDGDDSFSHDTASTTTNSDTSIVKLTKAEQRERKKAAKARKSQQKAAKNEARHATHITAEDVKNVERILHGEKAAEQDAQRYPLATDKTIEDVIDRNLGFMKQIQSHKKALYETIRIGRKEEQQRRMNRKRVNEGFADVETEAVVDAVLLKFGIDPTAGCGNKKGRGPTKPSAASLGPENKDSQYGDRSKIMAKLRVAIKDDFEKHENDLHQTYIRAGGFFRYAGKAVFERMTEIARNIDLQTGEDWDKKRRRELAGQTAEAHDNA